MKNKPVFEYKSCGRCGGSGTYSFCTMYGNTCFGCGGKGYKLTGRGRAGVEFYRNALSVPVETLQVGDVIRAEEHFLFGGYRQAFAKIESISIDEANGGQIVLELRKQGKPWMSAGYIKGTLIRKAQTAETKQVTQAEAIALQEYFTASGKVKKVDIKLEAEERMAA